MSQREAAHLLDTTQTCVNNAELPCPAPPTWACGACTRWCWPPRPGPEEAEAAALEA